MKISVHKPQGRFIVRSPEDNISTFMSIEILKKTNSFEMYFQHIHKKWQRNIKREWSNYFSCD